MADEKLVDTSINPYEGSKYIRVEGVGDDSEITILDDGFINADFDKQMKYEFRGAKDITEPLHKKRKEDEKAVSVTHKGRTGYAPLTCIYPDNTESAKIEIQGCVIQYSKAVTRENSRYGTDFVIIGIPNYLIEHLIADAKKRSDINLAAKQQVKTQSGYHWMNCTLDYIPGNMVTTLFSDDEEIRKAELPLLTLLKDFECNLEATILFSVSATTTSDSMLKSIDLARANYKLSPKPHKIRIIDTSSVQAPELPDLQRRKNEVSEDSEKHLASHRLAEYAMKQLNINKATA